MKLLITGATGMIGSAVCAKAISDGHRVIAVIRPGSATRPAGIERIVALNIARATHASDWKPHLDGIDAVVNCAGVLQQGPRQSPAGVHDAGIAALFDACQSLQIRRIIHFSAIGVDRGAVSAFSRTKLAGDQALMAHDLDWVILRPSVVLGRAASGASGLIRGLAALPVLPAMPDTGPLQVVSLDELVKTVEFFLQPSAPGKVTLELAGPDKLDFNKVVAEYRRWLGWRPARHVRLSQVLAAVLYRLGDFAGRLGWRPAMRTTARREIVRGAVGDPSAWRELTGLPPRSLAEALAAEPASAQERWFARLYFLKPVIILVFALFWIGTAFVSLGPGFDSGIDLLADAGLPELAVPGVIAGGLADLFVGLAILYRPTARAELYCALALSFFYLVTGTALSPGLWSLPLGPMLKIWPIMMLNLVALCILDER